jgi:hypothetical protein
MIIRDDVGLNDMGFSLRKTLKKLAPHNLLKKLDPVQALRHKPKRRAGPAPAPAAAAAAAAPAGGGSPTPIPGGFTVEGNDASGNYLVSYFPDAASANAYNAQLQASGGYGTVAPTPSNAVPGGVAPYTPGESAPSGGAPSGGGASYGAPAPAYGPGAEDQSPYADEGGGDEGEQAPAADEEEAPRKPPSKLPKAPAVSPVPTIAPTAAESGIPTWMWVAGAAVVAGGVYIVLKKKGIV